jgi:hypothetical protein
VNRLGPAKSEFLGCLVNCLLRKTDKLLDITNRSLDIHCRNIQTKRRQLNCDHVLGVCNILPELLNIQRTTEHSEHMAMRCRGQSLIGVESPIQIGKKSMTGPTQYIIDGNVIIEIRKGALRRAVMSLADIHVLIGIITHRQNCGLPWERMAAP